MARSGSSTLVIGPSGCGKTTLLSVLCLASAQNRVSTRDDAYLFRVRPLRVKQQDGTETAAMSDLEEAALQAVQHGRLDVAIPPTQGVTVYGFELIVDLADSDEKIYAHQKLGMPSAFKGSFLVYDGPGGALFGKVEDANVGVQARGGQRARGMAVAQKRLLQVARQSRCLIVCVEPHSGSAFFQYLGPFLRKVGDPAPFRRIAIVVTKADLYALDNGIPRARLNDPHHDPVDIARTAMTRVAWGRLIEHLHPECDVVCGWASAYGFIPETGEPNYDPHPNRKCFRTFRERDSVEAVLNNWQPFQVADPFIFALTGDPCSMKRVQL